MTSFCNCELCQEIKRNIAKRKIQVFINATSGYKYGIGDIIEHLDLPGLFIIESIYPDGAILANSKKYGTVVLDKKGIGERYHPDYKVAIFGGQF